MEYEIWSLIYRYRTALITKIFTVFLGANAITIDISRLQQVA